MEGMESLADLPESEMGAYSPEEALARSEVKPPPVFIARAGRDHPATNQSIDSFLQKALAANVDIDFANHPEGQHGFDVLNDMVRSREIIALAMSFVKKRLAAPGASADAS
jgi:dienelactone hydrolase